MDGSEVDEDLKYLAAATPPNDSDETDGNPDEFIENSISSSDFQSLPLDSSLDSTGRNISLDGGYRIRCSSWERGGKSRPIFGRSGEESSDIDCAETSELRNLEMGLPEKYFLPSPTAQTENDDASSLTSRQNFSSFLMTRGEPMGEESENGNIMAAVANYAGPSSFDDDNESELSESASGNGLERPPVVGQSNDPRGQVASGMSCNSSDNVSSTYNSALSGSWNDYDAELDGNDEVRDSLSVKVSLLLGDDNDPCPQSDSESPINQRQEESSNARELADETDSTTNLAESEENVAPVPEDRVANDAEEGAILPVRTNERRLRIVEVEKFDVRPMSPTSVSSVASSKRLEWDSGADIGYKNVSTSTISRTEAEVLQWANHHHLPLTRTEPEGKSFQKEKGGAAAAIRFVPTLQPPDEDAKEDGKDRLQVTQVDLASSMTSITSQMFQEVLYGVNEESRNAPKVSTDDDVIVRVRKLLRQTNRSGGSSPSKGNETPEKKKISGPEDSPSHSSSSWSAKSSNTVVMTPVGQRIDDFSLMQDEANSSAFIQFNEETPAGIDPKYENLIFLRKTRPTNIEVSSVSVQTETKSDVSVPRPVFPSGKSKSLDILPTVLVDVAVNTEFPYSPSSEENMSPEDAPRNFNGYGYPSMAGNEVGSFEAVPINHSMLDDVSEGMIDEAVLLGETRNDEPRTDLDQFARENNLVYHQDIGGEGWVREIPLQPCYKHCSGEFRERKRRSGDSTRSWCKSKHVSEEKSTQRVAPFWPAGADNMYYTIQDVPGSCEFRQDVSSVAAGHSCRRHQCQNRHETVPKMVTANVSPEENFEPVNVSKQSSSTDISLPTKKFVDRTQWLQKMAQLENDRARAEIRPSPSNDEESWRRLSATSSRFASTCDTSSELELPSTKKNRKEGKGRHPRSESSIKTQMARLKSIIVEQRHSYVRRLWREVERIEKLEALIPSIGNETSTTTFSPDESELVEYLQRRRSKPKARDAERPKNKPSQRRNGADEPLASPATSSPPKQQTRDFCHSFPSPVPDERNERNEKVPSRASVGLQTTVLPEMESVGGKKPIGWVIPFSQSKVEKKSQEQLSLQEAFKLQALLNDRIQGRHQELARVVQHRHRARQLRSQVPVRDFEKLLIDAERPKVSLRQNSAKKQKRVFTHREMLEQTERVYRNLPEVQQKTAKCKRQQEYQTNRIIAQIYQKKVQEKALKGQVSWLHTQKCLAF